MKKSKSFINNCRSEISQVADLIEEFYYDLYEPLKPYLNGEDIGNGKISIRLGGASIY
jgi:hypothetical protein